MKIKRYKTKEKVYGYLDTTTGDIYIRDDMVKTDYIETLVHETIHWVIWKLIKRKRIQNWFHMWFDMVDCSIQTFGDFNMVREYWRDYKNGM